MDNLPLELIEYIFNYLDLKNKIKCRRISKNFLNLIDNYLINDKNDLIFAEINESYYKNFRFFFLNKFVNFNNLILKLNLNDNFFKHSTLFLKNKIKQLVICELSKSILIDILKAFDKIEILFLHNFNDQNTSNGNLFIKLNHLKILELDYCKRRQFKFYLPALKKLSIVFPTRGYNFRYKFIYPESIEYCKFNRYYRLIDKFINLKVLYCYDFVNDFGRENDYTKDNFLTNFPKLEELHLDEIEYFKKFKRQQIIYKLNHLKIYLFGLQLENLADYKECTKEFDINKFNLYIKNQLKLSDHRIPFEQYKLDFELIKPIYSKLPKNFFLKLDEIDYLHLNATIDDELINFIKFSSIRFYHLELKILAQFIEEEFFRNLLVYAPNLCSIEFLKDENDHTEIKIKEDDLKILWKFTNLVWIQFNNLEIKTDFAIDSFKNLNMLKSFSLNFGNQDLSLFKMNQNEFKLKDYNSEKSEIIFKDLESVDFKMLN